MTETLFNANCTAEKRSADNVLGMMRAMGGNLGLVRDSGKLVAMCADPAVQIRCIFRAAGDDPGGDPVGRNDPYGFINSRNTAAPQATWIHGTNEVGFSPSLNSYTLQLATAAEAVGKRIVAYNASTNQDVALWKTAETTIRELVRRKHKIGVHLYLDGTHDAGGYASLDWLQGIGVGASVFVTEYAYIKSIFDANVGYRAVMDAGVYNDWQDSHAAKMAAYGYPCFHFSLTHWNDDARGKAEGFGSEDHPEIQTNFAALNVKYPIQEHPVNPTPPYLPGANPAPKLVNATAGLKLRTQPTTSSTTIRIMPYQEAITVYAQPVEPNDGYNWQRVTDALGSSGWSANAVNGVPTWVDPAPIPPPQAVASIIDVSQYNGSINWAKLKMAGVTKAIIRSVIGITGEDSAWHLNVSSALAVGIKVSFYCVFEPQLDGVAQAQAFFHKHSFADCWMSPAVDVELDMNMNPDAIADGLLLFVNEFRRLVGYSPTIYTSWGFWNGKVSRKHDNIFGVCPLWLAAYQDTPPNIPHAWCQYALWQYSSSAVIDGNGSDHVDVSRLP